LDLLAMFEKSIEEHLRVVQTLRRELPAMQQIAEKMSDALLNGHKILWCGNGGSAADSQHLAAEFVGRFLRERRALPSIALTTNTSILTAIGNDYGYESVFRRQVEAMCLPGDVLVGISTSGNSQNVYQALKAAREIEAFTVAFTGATGGMITEFADANIKIPSTETPRIQEGHILCGHMICDYVENRVCQAQAVEPQKITR
jgi:D-sedoheptulose 7-phosphate isomerase